jgi:parallel beta-helix repeat protein
MLRVVSVVLLVSACASPAGGETEGSSSAAETTSGAPTSEGSGEASEATTSDELPDGCDVLVRGEVEGSEGLQAAIDGADAGARICVRGEFTGTATIGATGKSGLTITGIGDGESGLDGAVFEFGRAAGAPGFRFEDVEGLTLEHLTVRGTLGDGIVVSGGTDLKMVDVTVGWDGANTGAELFAIRADNLTGVLIDGCEASGGRDAGIFVQQSRSVIVRDSRATGNVSGIELENCAGAEVHDNTVSGNVIGLFVLDLPDTPFGNGGDVLVRDNTSDANNAVNFAEEGSVVASIPAGIGALVLASDRVELRGNSFTGNDTTGVLVVSFAVVGLLSGMMFDDPGFDPYPQTIEIHDNRFAGNGTNPAELFASVFMLAMMPAITWDGAADEMKDDPALRLCIRDNGDADFLNIDALDLGADKSPDLAPHDCDHPDVAPIDDGA